MTNSPFLDGEPARLTPTEDERQRSINNIDQNASGEAWAVQSARDVSDWEAGSPADEGGESGPEQ